MIAAFQRSYDKYGIFLDGQRLVPSAQFSTLATSETARLPEQPIENGTSLINHKIDNLVRVSLLAILTGANARNDYDTLRVRYDNADIMSLATPVRFYPNVALASISFQTMAERPDTYEVFLDFVEVRYYNSTFAALPPEQVLRPQLASTVNRGAQEGDDVEVDRSILKDAKIRWFE